MYAPPIQTKHNKISATKMKLNFITMMKSVLGKGKRNYILIYKSVLALSLLEHTSREERWTDSALCHKIEFAMGCVHILKFCQSIINFQQRLLFAFYAKKKQTKVKHYWHTKQNRKQQTKWKQHKKSSSTTWKWHFNNKSWHFSDNGLTRHMTGHSNGHECIFSFCMSTRGLLLTQHNLLTCFI